MASLAGLASAPERERPGLLLDTHLMGRDVALQTERATSAVWECGAGRRTIANFLARGGDSGRLINVPARGGTLCPYAHSLAVMRLSQLLLWG